MDAAKTATDALAYYQELEAALAPREAETPHATVRRLLGNFREADTESCTLLAESMRSILATVQAAQLAAAKAAFAALEAR